MPLPQRDGPYFGQEVNRWVWVGCCEANGGRSCSWRCRWEARIICSPPPRASWHRNSKETSWIPLHHVGAPSVMDTLATPVRGTKHPRPTSLHHHAWPVKNCSRIFPPISSWCIPANGGEWAVDYAEAWPAKNCLLNLRQAQTRRTMVRPNEEIMKFGKKWRPPNINSLASTETTFLFACICRFQTYSRN